MFLVENWEVIALVILAIYEIVARFIPTDNNWSIVHAVVKILDIIVKNKTKKVGVSEDGTTKRKLFRIK